MGQATLLDIARAVGTSTATVSRVLSKSGYPVRESLRQRVLETARQLNYEPNLAGRLLKTRRSQEIGVIIPTVTNPFYARVLLGIESEARRRGYHVLFCDSFRHADTERAYIRTLQAKQVAGLIISSLGDDPALMEKLGRRGMQVVVMEQSLNDAQIHSVGFDFVKTGLMAVDHLAELGHKNLVFVTTPLARRSRRERLEGFRLGLAKHGLGDGRVLVSADEKEQESLVYEFSAGRSLAGQLLQLDPLPDGVVAVNDLVAMSLIQHLTAAGVRIPQDLSVIGFDNLEFAEMITPALTTIEQPALEMGKMACQILVSQIDRSRQEQPPDQKAQAVAITLEPRLVSRQSTTRRTL